ncbi:hypothetical protein T484DRAFT_1903731 [Baffinella frigidus]|nr:hypothetical protein T484DRAFT_1903731 [Cryptophyta sp. CCMP2293]
MTLAPKSYMGRIFLTPVKFSPEQGPQFWVNIGFNTAGNQIFPEWCVQMEGAVSKPDYDALMKDLKEYFDAEAGSPASVIAQNFGLNCGCLFAHFESGMNAVLARHAPRFPGGIIIERKDEEMSKPVANVPQEQSVDQYGNGLFATVGKSRRWPPVGYNLILQVPREKAAETSMTAF